MPSKNPAQRLHDIVENIVAVRDFISGMDLDSFRSSRRTVYAVTRAMEIISEASRRLPEDLKSRHPALDWAAIAAAKNVYRHGYETVDEALIGKPRDMVWTARKPQSEPKLKVLMATPNKDLRPAANSPLSDYTGPTLLPTELGT